MPLNEYNIIDLFCLMDSSFTNCTKSEITDLPINILDIVILISGRGSNMKSIIDAVEMQNIPNVRVSHVISNVADAHGLVIAQNHGIACSVISDVKKELSIKLKELNPDIICMAGFMRIVPSDVVNKYVVLNIHPALLPMYPGLHAQRQAIQDGAKWSGCTVHYADEGVDTGPIIVQYAVPVLEDDTEETLAKRILQKEHIAYPHAIRLVVNNLKKPTKVI